MRQWCEGEMRKQVYSLALWAPGLTVSHLEFLANGSHSPLGTDPLLQVSPPLCLMGSLQAESVAGSASWEDRVFLMRGCSNEQMSGWSDEEVQPSEGAQGQTLNKEGNKKQRKLLLGIGKSQLRC